MTSTKVFQSGNSHAIRIPAEIPTALGQDFIIRRVGRAVVLLPADDPRYALRETVGTFPKDFLEDRAQPSWDQAEKREEI